MRLSIVLPLALFAALQLIPASAVVAGERKWRFGLEGGLAYTPDDSFDGVGWSLAGLAETPLTDYCGIRASVGGTLLEADVDDRHPNANYAYATVGVTTADLVSFFGGAGIYYTMLQEPLVDDEASRLEAGLYGGAMFSVPYRHRHFITASLTGHRVFADGPDFFVVLSGGFIF